MKITIGDDPVTVKEEKTVRAVFPLDRSALSRVVVNSVEHEADHTATARAVAEGRQGYVRDARPAAPSNASKIWR